MHNKEKIKIYADLYGKSSFHSLIKDFESDSSISIDNCGSVIIKYLYNSYFRVSEYELALKFCREYIFLCAPKVDSQTISIARKSLAKLKASKQEQFEYWRSCETIYDKAFGSIHEALLQDLTIDSKRFLNELSSLFINRSDCERLLGIIEFMRTHQDEIDDSNDLNGSDLVRKKKTFICVSGMGYSGSGAVYDYFSEYQNVYCLKGENHFLARGEYSVKSICKYLKNDELLKKNLLGFLFNNIIGFNCVTSSSSYLSFFHSRSIFFGDGFISNIDIVKRFGFFYKMLLQADRNNRDPIFRSFCSFILNEVLAVEANSTDCKYVLLDNLIPIHSATMINYLDDVLLTCTFRDPRSNYCAVTLESGIHNQSLNEFIDGAKEKLVKYHKELDGLINSEGMARKVFKVEFESFVVSKKYRDELALGIGLNLDDRTEFDAFQPWVSFKNVILHEHYTDQEAVSKIEQELGEYCIDVFTKNSNLNSGNRNQPTLESFKVPSSKSK